MPNAKQEDLLRKADLTGPAPRLADSTFYVFDRRPFFTKNRRVFETAYVHFLLSCDVRDPKSRLSATNFAVPFSLQLRRFDQDPTRRLIRTILILINRGVGS